MVNKKLMAKYGIELASLIAYLIDQERYHEGKEFYCTDPSIKLYTGINIDRISTIKKTGVEKGLFKIIKKGIPSSSYYYINHNVISEEISSDSSVSDLAYNREIGDTKLTRESILKMSRDSIRLLSRKLGIKYKGTDKKVVLTTNLIDFLQLQENPVTSDQKIPSLVTDIDVTSDGYIPLNKETKYLETKNKETVVAIEEQDPTAFPEDIFFKKLKDLLSKANIENINSNTLKNIKEFSNGDLDKVKKVLEFIKLKNKNMNSKILVAILRDKDHLVIEPTDLQKITKKEKVEFMKNKLGILEIRGLRNLILKEIGFKCEGVDFELERVLCKRFDKLKLRGEYLTTNN